MPTMNISLPEPLRAHVQDRIDTGRFASVSDYFRDLIRRDQAEIGEENRWLRELDATVAASVEEMKAGRGTDIDMVHETTVGILTAARSRSDR